MELKNQTLKGQTNNLHTRHIEAETNSVDQNTLMAGKAFPCKSQPNFRFYKIDVKIGGIANVEMLIDSGCETNIMSLDNKDQRDESRYWEGECEIVSWPRRGNRKMRSSVGPR